MADTIAPEISCDFVGCPTPAVRGGIVAVQPNGLTPAHGIYYACGEHQGILTDALETWPVAALPAPDRDAAVRHALDQLDAALCETNGADLAGTSDDVLAEVDRWANSVQTQIARVRRAREGARNAAEKASA